MKILKTFQKAHFGIGGFFRHSRSQRNTDYMVLTENIVSYVYTDTLNTNDSDYVRTSTALTKAYRTYRNLDITFTCPVGLEYNIGKQIPDKPINSPKHGHF